MEPLPRVALVVMPVVNVDRPSISIAKLRSVVDRELADRVSTEVHYVCHDFAEYMAEGRDLGELSLHDVLLDNQHLGLPDWLFRQEAFPEAEDNTERYFRRFFPGRTPARQEFVSAILERRAGLGAFLEEMIDRYRLDQARIVGFTSLFVQGGAVFAMARRLKERNPDVTIVVGGQNCDSPMGEEYARNVAALDYVFSGPGLVSFPAFVRHQLDGDLEACRALNGVFTAETVEREPSARAGDELDIDVEVPVDYSEFFASFERRFGDTDAVPQVHLETSRGCWWGEKSHCTFCGLNGETMAYRAMKPELAIRQFRDLFDPLPGEDADLLRGRQHPAAQLRRRGAAAHRRPRGHQDLLRGEGEPLTRGAARDGRLRRGLDPARHRGLLDREPEADGQGRDGLRQPAPLEELPAVRHRPDLESARRLPRRESVGLREVRRRPAAGDAPAAAQGRRAAPLRPLQPLSLQGRGVRPRPGPGRVLLVLLPVPPGVDREPGLLLHRRELRRAALRAHADLAGADAGARARLARPLGDGRGATSGSTSATESRGRCSSSTASGP